MKKFVAFGDYESVVIYNVYGWDVIYVNLKNKKSILEKFKEIINSNRYERIFVIEECYEILKNEFPDFKKTKVSIIPIPSIKGSKNIAKQKYKKLAAIATGIKLE